MNVLAVLAFLLCIPAANWMIHTIGTVCIPDGPCLIPVAPGLMAPSGVLVIGLALVLRDYIQHQYGKRVVLACILIGAGLSAAVASPTLVIASATAFLLSELADFAVYTPLARRRLIVAVVLSGLVGAVIDSAVFLWLAFGSLDHVSGQVVGKVMMSLFAVPVIWYARHRTAIKQRMTPIEYHD